MKDGTSQTSFVNCTLYSRYTSSHAHKEYSDVQPHAWGYLCTPQPDLDTTGEGGGVHNTLNVIGCQLMQDGAVVSGGGREEQ